ncbi:MAG: tyrosine-type recombinase/integrase [Anaerolineales bacterium]|nr:tyrosine-type recombinase/integrase [Anaerolineales bacterium]
MTSQAPSPQRFIGLDIHKHYLVAVGVDAHQEQVFGPRRVQLSHLDGFIRKGRSLPRDVSDGDLAALFACIDQPRDRAMFTLMVRCGLRVGEVHSLSMPDLSLTPSPGMLPRLWIHGKGSIERVAYLSPQAYSALVSWLAVRPAGQSRAVFLNMFGRRISVTGIQDRLAKYCRLAGLWVTCHQLRHTFGRHLTEAHVPVTTIQVLMGHARIRSTEVYLHISNTQVQAEYELAMTAINQRMTLLGSTP